MIAQAPQGAPVLSTPDTHAFEDQTPLVDLSSLPRLSDKQLYAKYEIEKTVDEIRAGQWKHIALQFPDHMLADAPRVYRSLSRRLYELRQPVTTSSQAEPPEANASNSIEKVTRRVEDVKIADAIRATEESLFILADTSYGACCVDEIAAEHANADVVVHYGRSCLSPTARLPVIYCFTKPPLDTATMLLTFKETYPDMREKIILMADVPFCSYIPELAKQLTDSGYSSLFATSIVHDTSSPLPNRTIPPDVIEEPTALNTYHLFHISDPPASLLLILSSRLKSTRIYPTAPQLQSSPPKAPVASSTAALRRRYALLTTLTTAPILGILINTLSVRNYLPLLSHIQQQITSAGKKAYTFVVGKVNAAKIANFSEVAGWVVVGCWESSLFESRDFWRPVVTPWELSVALRGDAERVWTGEWETDFGAVMAQQEQWRRLGAEAETKNTDGMGGEDADTGADAHAHAHAHAGLLDDEAESAPPEFDLRTGRYVSHSRPMATAGSATHTGGAASANGEVQPAMQDAVMKLAKGDLATVGGAVSPGAEFLKSGRTWRGLGSDFDVSYEHDGLTGAAVEQGRSGIARGYVVGDDETRH